MIPLPFSPDRRPLLPSPPPLISEAPGRIQRISRDNGVTVLIVEQKVREVLKIAHRVHVLRTGRVSFTGPAEELKDEKKLKEVYLYLDPGRSATGSPGASSHPPPCACFPLPLSPFLGLISRCSQPQIQSDGEPVKDDNDSENDSGRGPRSQVPTDSPACTTEQDFIENWLTRVQSKLPNSQVVAAIRNETQSGRLEETRLLEQLRELSKPAKQEGPHDQG